MRKRKRSNDMSERAPSSFCFSARTPHRGFRRAEQAQTAAEYVVIIIVIAVVVLLSIRIFGKSIYCQYSRGTAEIKGHPNDIPALCLTTTTTTSSTTTSSTSSTTSTSTSTSTSTVSTTSSTTSSTTTIPGPCAGRCCMGHDNNCAVNCGGVTKYCDQYCRTAGDCCWDVYNSCGF